jgi:hypothetical protein
MHGLNVRHWNYLDPNYAAPVVINRNATQPWGYPWDNFVSEEAWIVTVYDDGLDCGEFDDYPGDHVASHHRTRKGAEAEAAWLIHAGIEENRIHVFFARTSEIDYNIPMRD